MSTTPTPDPKETDSALHVPHDEDPGLKPESSADAEGNSDGTPPDAPTSDDGYEEKAESTEEAEGPTAIEN